MTLYQAPEDSDVPFKTELMRMATRMERLALEATQTAEKQEERAARSRKAARVLTEKAAGYFRLAAAEYDPAATFDDIPF